MKKNSPKPFVGKSYKSQNHAKLLIVDWCRERKSQKSLCDLEKILSELKAGLALEDIAHHSFLNCLMDSSFAKKVNSDKTQDINALCEKYLNDDIIYESRKNFETVVTKLAPNAILFVGNSLTDVINNAMRGLVNPENNWTKFLQNQNIQLFDYNSVADLKDLRNFINFQTSCNVRLILENLMATVLQLEHYYLENISSPLFYDINGSEEYTPYFRYRGTDLFDDKVCHPNNYIEYVVWAGQKMNDTIPEMEEHYNKFLMYYHSIESLKTNLIVFKKNPKKNEAARNASHAASIKGKIKKYIKELNFILSDKTKNYYKSSFFFVIKEILTYLKEKKFETALTPSDYKSYSKFNELIIGHKVKDQQQIVTFLSLCRESYYQNKDNPQNFETIINALEIFVSLPMKIKKER